MTIIGSYRSSGAAKSIELIRPPLRQLPIGCAVIRKTTTEPATEYSETRHGQQMMESSA